MWQTDYQARLADWFALRKQCDKLPLVQQLETVNAWWFRAPMVNQSIRWNEQTFWPNPWELLVNSGYCDLARSLGIVYTLMMLESTHYCTLEIAGTDQDNLVLVDSGKYILNWSPNELLNIHSTPVKVSQSIDSNALNSFLN